MTADLRGECASATSEDTGTSYGPFHTQNVTAVGEKTRDHPHYLKGSVFCGNCGSRLIISHAKNRHGEVYEYFMCSGRHAKRTDCLFRAVEVGLVEQKVEELYRFVRLSAEAKETICRKLTTEFAALDVGRQDDEERLTKQRVTESGGK